MARLAICVFFISIQILFTSARAQERLALLIGNQGYTQKVGALKNPHSDVDLIEVSLKRLGFKVSVLKDASYKAMDSALKRYVSEVRRAGPGALSFFYYSGHGVANPETQINYLIPVDVADADDDKVWFESLQQNAVIDLLSKQAGNATHYVVFDACRNELRLAGPAAKALGTQKGFVPISDTYGLLIAYATAPKETASDMGVGGGPYAKALAEELLKPGVEAVSMFRNVQIRVKQSIGQDPWLSFPSLPPVYFAGRADAAPARTHEAIEAWSLIKDTTSVPTLEAFAARFKDTFYADMARARIEALKKEQVAIAAPPVAAPHPAQPAPHPASPTLPPSVPAGNSSWVRLCEKGTCTTQHERLDANSGLVLTAAEVGDAQSSGRRHVQFLVPLGMLTQPGLRAIIYPKDQWAKLEKNEKADDSKHLGVINATYTECLPVGCKGAVEITSDMARDLGNAGGMMLWVINANGQPVSFPIPLSDFQYASQSAPVDPVKYAAARDELLKQMEKRSNKPVGSISRQRPFLSAPAMATPTTLGAVVRSDNALSQQSTWVKLCEKTNSTVKNGDGKEEKKEFNICLTHHERLDPNSGMVWVSAALRQIEGQDKRHLMIMVPLGVTHPSMRVSIYPKVLWEKLRKNGKLEPGDEARLREAQLNYTLCHPAGCTAETEASPALISELRTGGGIGVQADVRGTTVHFAIALAGFDQALDGPPVDNKKYAEARKALIEQFAKRQQDKAKK